MKLLKAQEMLSMSFYFLRMPVTPVIRKPFQPEEVLAESMKKIYESAEELEIEEHLESDDDVESLLLTRSKRREQKLPRSVVLNLFAVKYP